VLGGGLFLGRAGVIAFREKARQSVIPSPNDDPVEILRKLVLRGANVPSQSAKAKRGSGSVDVVVIADDPGGVWVAPFAIVEWIGDPVGSEEEAALNKLPVLIATPDAATLATFFGQWREKGRIRIAWRKTGIIDGPTLLPSADVARGGSAAFLNQL
jgi:hypothetical protein